MKVAVLGFGNAGQHIAKLLAADGHKIIAASDSKGAVHCADGLDIAMLMKAKSDGESIASTAGKDGYECLTDDEFLSVDCDVLIPSAMANMIHDRNASQIKAKFILELANGPVTLQADQILAEKGTIILPDILANAGGVTVSYFEWVQNRQGLYWTIDEIRRKLKSTIEREGRAVWQLSQKKKWSVRTAAYTHALSRLVEAFEARAI